MHRPLFFAFFAVCALFARSAVGQSADLSVDISNLGPALVVGTTATANFCLTVTNAGPDSATNVVVEYDQDVGGGFLSTRFLPVPSCPVYPAWLGTCTSAAGHTQCVVPKLDPGSYVALQGVQWAGATTEPVSVTATIHSDTPDGNSANNSSTEGVTPVWSAFLHAYASADMGAPPGETFAVRAQIENGGPSNALDVVMTAILPEHTTLAGIEAPDGATCSTPTASTLSCAIPSVAGYSNGPTGYALVKVTLAVDASATSGTPLPFTMFVTASNASSPGFWRTSTATAHVYGPADPAVTISAPATAYGGMSYPVSIKVTNNGPGDSYAQVVLNLKTDHGVSLPAANSPYSNGWVCATYDERPVTICKNYSPLAKGATANLQVNYTLTPDLDLEASSLTAEAVLSDPYDVNPANNTSTATSEVVLPPWSYVNVSLDPSPAYGKAGDLVTWTLRVGNSSPIPAENAVATLRLPPELKVVSNDFPCGVGTCSLGTLPGRTTNTYTVVVQVVSAAPKTVNPYLEVRATNQGPYGNPATWGSFGISGSITDLALTIAAPAVVHPGPAQWTFHVTNLGPDTGTAFYIRFLTPPGTTFSRFIGAAAGVCAPPWYGVVGVISCNGYGLFVPNATWLVTVELNVEASAPSPIQLSAEVVRNDGSYDPSSANNTATASTLLANAANLSIAVIASDASETWEYHVTNNGPDSAKGVIFSVKVPADVTITSVRSNTGRCDFSGCFLGDLLPQAMDTVWVTLHPTKTGLFQVFASAEAANAPQVTIARMLRSRSGTEAVDLSLAASMTPQLLYVGDTATFTYYVTNRSNVAAEDVNIDIHLPQQFSFVSGSPGCDATHCALGTIVSGDTVSATITAVATSAGYSCTDSHTSCAKAEVNESDNAAAQIAVILPAPASRHRATPH